MRLPSSAGASLPHFLTAPLVPCGQLGELDKAILRRLRIDERDAAAGMADPRRLVDQWNPLRLELRQCLVDVLDLEADVVEPTLPLRDHALVLAVGTLAGDQLDHRLSDVVERELPLLVLLLPAQRNSEAPFPQPAAGFGVFDDHSYVLYALYLHGSTFIDSDD